MQYLFDVAAANNERLALIAWWSDADLIPEHVGGGCYDQPCASYASSYDDYIYCAVIASFRSTTVHT